MPVATIAQLYLDMGETLEAIASEYDLTRPAVFAAMAYYYDHKSEIDRQTAMGPAFRSVAVGDCNLAYSAGRVLETDGWDHADLSDLVFVSSLGRLALRITFNHRPINTGMAKSDSSRPLAVSFICIVELCVAVGSDELSVRFRIQSHA